LWLLFNLYPQRTRLAAMGLALVFAGAALYRWVTGEASCGCFGRFEVPPSLTFISDLVFLVALGFARPSNCIAFAPRQSASLMLPCAVTATFVIGTIAMIAVQWRRSADAHRTAIAGLSVSSRVLDLGYVQPGQRPEGVFILQNQGTKVLRFLNASPSCTCSVANAVPRDLQPGQSMAIPVSLQIAPNPDPIVSADIVLSFSDGSAQLNTILRITARIDTERLVCAIPARLDLGDAALEQSVWRTVHIRAPAELIRALPDQIEAIPYGDVRIIAQSTRASKGGMQYRPVCIRMTIPEDLKGSIVTSTVTIEFPGSKFKPLVVPVRARVVRSP